MTEIPRDELLSAYLDGELSPEEKVRAERLLAGDPAARQQLDDLRTLSEAVRALPVMSLGEDLSARVLRAAERRVLAGAAERPEELEEVPVLSWRSLARRLTNRRALAWSGMAVAVALLVMVLQPEENQRRGMNVVRAPAETDRAAKEGPVLRAAGKAPAAESVAETEMADKASSGLSRMKAGKAPEAAPRRGVGSVAKGAAPANLPALSGAPPSEAPAAEPQAPASRPTAAEPLRPPVAAKPQGPSAPAVAAPPAPGSLADWYSEGVLPKSGAPAEPPPAENYSPKAAKAAKGGWDVQAPSAPLQEVRPVLVVRCEVKPDVDLRENFGRILARQNIVVQNESPTGSPGVAKSVEQSAQPAREGSSMGTLAGAGGMGAMGGAGMAGSGQREEYKQVLVEAGWDQLEAALGEVSRQPDLFLTLSTQPATREAADRVPPTVRRYDRGRLEPPGQSAAEPSADRTAAGATTAPAKAGGQEVERKDDAEPQSDQAGEKDRLKAGVGSLAKSEKSQPEQQTAARSPQRGYARWFDQPLFAFDSEGSSPSLGVAVDGRPSEAARSWQAYGFGQQETAQPSALAPLPGPQLAPPGQAAQGQAAQELAVQRQAAPGLAVQAPAGSERHQVLFLFRLTPPEAAAPKADAQRAAAKAVEAAPAPAESSVPPPAPPPAPR